MDNIGAIVLFNFYSLGHVYFVLHRRRTMHGKVLEMRFVRRGGMIFHGGGLSVVARRPFRGSSPESCFISIRSDDRGGGKWCETLLEWL